MRNPNASQAGPRPQGTGPARVTASWSFSGQDLTSATLTRMNPDGSTTPLYGGADVDPQGQYDDLMMSPGTYSYT
ncbi:MAG TPA: hypothetical protein VLL77_01855 [Anaerolineales bacterium]|nr:hypothetical protein [Anaerolineales bacterium]